jgi:hypothetical protein
MMRYIKFLMNVPDLGFKILVSKLKYTKEEHGRNLHNKLYRPK